MDQTAEDFLKRALAAYVQRIEPEKLIPVYLAPDRFVTVKLFAQVSGRTENAVRMKIKEGKWIEGREFVYDPDRRVMIDREGVQRWVLNGR